MISGYRQNNGLSVVSVDPVLMALAQQFPGIGTSVTVPETFTPLFAAAGYTPLSLQQYEMTMDLADAKSA